MLERAEVVFSVFFQKKELPPRWEQLFLFWCAETFYSPSL